MIEEHLQEVRCLRQRLEESIRTNERLRLQLEEKLASNGHEGGDLSSCLILKNTEGQLCLIIIILYRSGAATNIYIQGLDTVTQLSNEIRVLKEENLALQSRLQASTGDYLHVIIVWFWRA